MEAHTSTSSTADLYVPHDSYLARFIKFLEPHYEEARERFRHVESVKPLSDDPEGRALMAVSIGAIERNNPRVRSLLKNLENRGLGRCRLIKKPRLLSAAVQFLPLVERAGKLRVMRNALLNLAFGPATEEGLQRLFLSYIEAFTTLHLRVLRAFQQPRAHEELTVMLDLSDVLENSVPQLRGNPDLYGWIWYDLYRKGLVDTLNLHARRPRAELTLKRTTRLGDQFLQLTSKPVARPLKALNSAP